MKPIYKKRDFVKVKSALDPGMGMMSYRFAFVPYIVKKMGGKIYRIASVCRARKNPYLVPRKNILPDDGYKYTLEGDNGRFMFCSSMFEEEF